MKKLLAFVLVLAVASMANAAILELSVDGEVDGPGNVTEIWLLPSETVVIDVKCTGLPGPDQFWVAIVEGPGEWLSGLGNLHQPPAPTGLVLEAYPYAGVDWIHAVMPSPTTDGDLGVWWEAIFHCTDYGDVTIQLMDESGYIVEDTIIIHQDVPEPVTMSLLGLGGLALIRRRHA